MRNSPSKERLVVHDYFAIRGGGERLALTLAEGIEAALMFGFKTADTYSAEMFPQNAINLELPPILQRSLWRVPALASWFARKRQLTAKFRTRVFSGVAAPFAAPESDSGTNIYYCHTPPRFLYDQREHFLKPAGTPGRLIQNLVLAGYENAYRRSVGRMEIIVANSHTVQDRIKHYLGRESVVVHPPCDTQSFVWQGQQDFYLSTARVAPLKRVEMIVDAFLGMPDKKLVVASGGSELAKLQRRAAAAHNITFVGWIDERKMRQLIGEAIATIYVPVNEDFGMSPVESMAAGKPVIGVSEGGLRETIVSGETGILLPPTLDSSDIADAVKKMTPALAAGMRVACQQQARKFSQENFLSSMSELLDQSVV